MRNKMSKIAKAVVTAVGAAGTILVLTLGDPSITDDWVAKLVAAITPLAVWRWPNA